MVGKVIRDYMEGGAKKLTVPGFGTFMRRDGGEMIFVDLLRGDDKTLSEMVEDRGGYSELEAMALIDRFIFETKNTIERNGSAAIEGFGTMTLDHKGVYQFNYSPAARPARETATQEKLFVSENPKVPTASGVTLSPSDHRCQAKADKRATADETRISDARSQGFSPTSQNRPPQKRQKFSRTDTILVIAIVAAVIALVALVFGMSSAGMPFMSE